jgi:transcriptional regulator with XRE-family HTH domain
VELSGGYQLRALREALGCTMRDVESASQQIARRLNSDEYAIPPSRLSDIETKGVMPSIFRMYSMAAIYRRDYRELLLWYGVNLDEIHLDVGTSDPPHSHISSSWKNVAHASIPVRLDPGFDLHKTSNLGRMIEKWGVVPLSYLTMLAAETRYTYGYIGAEDFTMYPLLTPGSFVQVDEAKNKPGEGSWRSEYERPIYFIETREGFVCSWCQVQRDTIILQPHPLSPVPVRVLRHPQEAEIIGQIVGVAMRLDAPGSEAKPKEHAEQP